MLAPINRSVWAVGCAKHAIVYCSADYTIMYNNESPHIRNVHVVLIYKLKQGKWRYSCTCIIGYHRHALWKWEMCALYMYMYM